MNDESTRIKSKRTILRSTVTKFCNKIENSLKETPINFEDLQEFLEQLITKSEELKIADSEIEKYLKPDEFEREFLTIEEYSEKITKWSFRAKKKINEIDPNSTLNLSTSHSMLGNPHSQDVKECMNIKLPKLSIPKFFGDSCQWLNFWNSFESAIHNNESLNKIDKFNYLKAHLGSIAASTVEGFSLSEENYDSVIELLKDRFGRKDILINAHLNNLLNIPPLKSSNDLVRFRTIVDKCQTQIRSLDSLGVISDSYGSILCPMLLKLLPSDLVLAFSKIESRDSNFNIKSLMEFLSKELVAREKAKFLSCQKTEESCRSLPNPSMNDKNKQSKFRVATAADLINREECRENKMACAFCSSSTHKSNQCNYARKLTLEDRKSILKKGGYCFRCLVRSHVARDCKKKLICPICNFSHLSIMCNSGKHIGNRNDENSQTDANESENSKVKVDLNNQCSFNEVYLQTLIVRVEGNNREFCLRTIIDTGSQNSYITKYAAKMLRLKSFREITVNHGLFGGMQVPENHKCYKVKLSSLDKSYNCEIEVLDQKQICSSIPKIENKDYHKKLKDMGIYVSDIFEREASRIFEQNPLEIHLLLGADIAGSLFTEVAEPLALKGLVALKTKLGWTLMGKAPSDQKCPKSSLSALSLSLQVSNCKIADLWRLDILGIMEDEQNKTKNELEEETLKFFSDTVKRDKEGRYEISLPFILDKTILPTNLNCAKNSLYKIEKSLRNSGKRADYDMVFREWEANGIIESLALRNPSEEKGTHYLPHHPVIKEASETTKIRPVFNASARMKASPSLNDCLTKGPNLIEIIPRILNRFRKYRVGISSDIEKAFLQISVKEEDRDYLRFLWFDSENKEKTYRHKRVVFGLTSSPFLLAATLNHLLDHTAEQFQDTVKILRNSFYVDNCLTSLNSVEEMNKFIEESRKILITGHFNLRCWQSNFPHKMIDESTPATVPVLGMLWNRESDTLTCKVDQFSNVNDPITKRKILSMTQKVFDPVGFTAPVTLIPKLILQQAWSLKVRWDEELPQSLINPFRSWLQQLPVLAQLHIPRWLHISSDDEKTVTLHIFNDASKRAYATCAYIRTENEYGVEVQLVSARSRVAPLKPMTIPRLELLSCFIGARLASTICSDLKLPNLTTILWSDSSTALAWIKREEQWGTFVHNRVKEIRTLTEPSDWRYVPGKLNPADLSSRGCSADQLLKSRWWEGPDWLKRPPDEWPQSEARINVEAVDSEKRKTIISATNIKYEDLDCFSRISTYRKLVRVVAWILRFLTNLKLNSKDRKLKNLNIDEINRAEKFILKRIQNQGLKESMKNIQTFVGSDGLLRVKSKISQRNDLPNFRYPILLPHKHEVVQKLIMDKHVELQHAGLQTLLSSLREDYWIIKGRRTIRQVLRTCVKCKRFSLQPLQSIAISLPEDRVKDASIFEVTGIDLCGPLFLRGNKKCWIVIFTCAIYRAVHLELVTSLSTECFILAVRRFIARRGRPIIIYSDNGKNLVGASNALDAIDWGKIEEFATVKKIRWKFNPPSAPWWGGFWERLIGLMKGILRKVLGKACLDEEELSTILCDTESLINSRPLTYLSEDPEELSALSPAMFLQEIAESGVPDLDCIDGQKLRKRFMYRVKVRQDLRNRFRNEYLGLLKGYSKSPKESSIEVGDLVLIGDSNTKRLNWPLAKVVKTYPGKDGKVRVVELKTQFGTLLRPIQRLYPLEVRKEEKTIIPGNSAISSDSDGHHSPANSSSSTEPPDQLGSNELARRHSRYGRLIKVPQRLIATV